MKIGWIGMGKMARIVLEQVHQAMPSVEHLVVGRQYGKLAGTFGQLPVREVSLEGLAQCEVIFIGVKPHQVSAVCQQLTPLLRAHSVVISMAAGISLDTLQQWLPHTQLVRMMPNTPMAVGEGVVTYCATDETSSQLFEQLMGTSGMCVALSDALIDVASVIAGSGPAFIYQVIEALSDAGVKHGLPRELAQALVAQTVRGAATMVQRQGKHPAALKDDVCSPGGSTIVGVITLEAEGLRHALIRATDQSMARVQQLG